MTGKPTRLALTLAIYPASSVVAWVAFENPFLPYDWGFVTTRDQKNERALRAIEKIVNRLQPETVVLEAFEPRTSRRADRIGRLGRAITALVADRGADVEVYPFTEVAACFAGVGARTREEIAAAVLRHVDAFRHQLPKRRRPWESEPRNLALFSAAALALTHYQLSASRLLDELRDAS